MHVPACATSGAWSNPPTALYTHPCSAESTAPLMLSLLQVMTHPMTTSSRRLRPASTGASPTATGLARAARMCGCQGQGCLWGMTQCSQPVCRLMAAPQTIHWGPGVQVSSPLVQLIRVALHVACRCGCSRQGAAGPGLERVSRTQCASPAEYSHLPCVILVHRQLQLGAAPVAHLI